MRSRLIIALLLIWMIAGTLDYADQVAEEQAYRRDVCENLYPDYKELEVTCN
ncbi:MAG: hypothetical protein ACO3EL_06225 [Burkholderiaceae bacterium]